jgi:hypothetical protein
MRTFAAALVCLTCSVALAKDATPKSGKEMNSALVALDQSLGLESYPPPHCLKWGFGHVITPEEVRKCADQALKGVELPDLGKTYVIAILMAPVGPQTLIAIALDAPGWAVLSCDPGKPCPPRHAGEDKMGKRVVDRSDRACKNDSTIWIPEKKGCP